MFNLVLASKTSAKTFGIVFLFCRKLIIGCNMTGAINGFLYGIWSWWLKEIWSTLPVIAGTWWTCRTLCAGKSQRQHHFTSCEQFPVTPFSFPGTNMYVNVRGHLIYVHTGTPIGHPLWQRQTLFKQLRIMIYFFFLQFVIMWWIYSELKRFWR